MDLTQRRGLWKRAQAPTLGRSNAFLKRTYQSIDCNPQRRVLHPPGGALESPPPPYRQPQPPPTPLHQTEAASDATQLAPLIIDGELMTLAVDALTSAAGLQYSGLIVGYSVQAAVREFHVGHWRWRV